MEKVNNYIKYYSLYDRVLAFFSKAGVIDLWNTMDNEFIKHHEDTWTLSEGFDELSTQFAKNLYLSVLHKITKEGRVLELGCGGGGALANLVKNRNKLLTVSDISFMAVHKSVNKSNGLQGLQMNSESLPIQSGAISCVYSTEMLEHVPNPEAVIREVSRILKQGGIFVFSIPCGSSTFVEDFVVPILKGIICKIARLPPPMSYRGHVHIFTEKSICMLAEKYNFEVIDKRFIKAGKGEKISSLPPKPFCYDVIRFFELPSYLSPPSVVYVFQKNG